MNAALETRTHAIRAYIITAGLIWVLAFIDFIILFMWGHGSIINRVSVLLQVLGFYNLSIGFLAGTKSLEGIVRLDGMTSVNTRAFVASNASLIGTLFSITSLMFHGAAALTARATPIRAKILANTLATLLIVVIFLALTLSILAYVVIVMPIAYLGYVPASVVVGTIMNTDREIVVSAYARGADPSVDKPSASVGVSKFVSENQVAVKSFVVGVPAIVLGLLIEIAGAL